MGAPPLRRRLTMSNTDEFFSDLERGLNPLAQARQAVEQAHAVAVAAVAAAADHCGCLYHAPANSFDLADWKDVTAAVEADLDDLRQDMNDDADDGLTSPSPGQVATLKALRAALDAILTFETAWCALRARETAEMAAAGALIRPSAVNAAA